MELHKLSSADGARKNRKRVGRGHGTGRGKTSGKGHKGQKARAGYSRRFGFEGGQMPLHRRLPKRGFRHESRFPLAIVNIDMLEKRFNDGDDVTVPRLIELGLADRTDGGVKILGRGEVTKKFNIAVQAVSTGARAAIEKAGGTINIEPLTSPPATSPETK